MTRFPLDERSLERLRRGLYEALMLLEMGYRREVVVKIVGDKNKLDKRMRSIIYRGVHTHQTIKSTTAKMVGEEGVRGRLLNVDFLNVLGSLQSAMMGDPLIICLDGVVRDVSEIHASILRQGSVEVATSMLIEVLKRLGPAKVNIVLEEQISRSGEVAAALRREIACNSLEGTAYTARSVDAELVKLGGITATSDSVIIGRCERVLDIARYCLEHSLLPRSSIIDLRKLLYSDWWAGDTYP